jgi:hypothetical protein
MGPVRRHWQEQVQRCVQDGCRTAAASPSSNNATDRSYCFSSATAIGAQGPVSATNSRCRASISRAANPTLFCNKFVVTNFCPCIAHHIHPFTSIAASGLHSLDRADEFSPLQPQPWRPLAVPSALKGAQARHRGRVGIASDLARGFGRQPLRQTYLRKPWISWEYITLRCLDIRGAR